jgi:beta-1,3-galactosyltransferase 1
VFIGAQPVQDKKSKWYTPQKLFNERIYPAYTSGTAYAMTTTAAAKLYAASALVPVFWLEDVYVTGLVARRARVRRVHSPKFNYDFKGISGCFFRKAATGHRYSVSDIRKVHAQVIDVNLTCS